MVGPQTTLRSTADLSHDRARLPQRRESAMPPVTAGARCRPRAVGRGLQGFTMIEVLIVVAIVAILVTVALPSYSNVTVKVNRSAAAQFMMDVANREEQYVLDQRAYTATIGTGGLGLSTPKDVAANYSFTAAVTGNDCTGNALSGPGYVITATPTGSQAKDGSLCLDSRNNKTPAAKWDL
jgi:type IV pilus assembly protein PilE